MYWRPESELDLLYRVTQTVTPSPSPSRTVTVTVTVTPAAAALKEQHCGHPTKKSESELTTADVETDCPSCVAFLSMSFAT